MKEKNALAERLKNAEGARKRFDEELKRYATENVSREEIRQSLEDEVRRLTQTVGQTEGEKREKEEQVARCEAYIDGMESKLQACQVSFLIPSVTRKKKKCFLTLVSFFGAAIHSHAGGFAPRGNVATRTTVRSGA